MTSGTGPGVAVLAGIMPALVTPLNDDGDVDQIACRRLVEHVLGAGVNGILALGSSGEGAALDATARAVLLETVMDSVAGRCPVIVGIAQPSLRVATMDARMAAHMGAVAVLATPPYYGPADDNTVVAFYEELADGSPLPVLAYNIPALTGVTVSVRAVTALAERGAIHGVKDSSRDFDYFQQVVVATRTRPGFSVLTGTDSLILPALRFGAHGAITVGANIVPGWCVSLHRAAMSGQSAEADELHYRLVRLGAAIRRGTFPAGAKGALSILGVCGYQAVPPTPSLGELDREALAMELLAIGIRVTSDGGPGSGDTDSTREGRAAG